MEDKEKFSAQSSSKAKECPEGVVLTLAINATEDAMKEHNITDLRVDPGDSIILNDGKMKVSVGLAMRALHAKWHLASTLVVLFYGLFVPAHLPLYIAEAKRLLRDKLVRCHSMDPEAAVEIFVANVILDARFKKELWFGNDLCFDFGVDLNVFYTFSQFVRDLENALGVHTVNFYLTTEKGRASFGKLFGTRSNIYAVSDSVHSKHVNVIRHTGRREEEIDVESSTAIPFHIWDSTMLLRNGIYSTKTYWSKYGAYPSNGVGRKVSKYFHQGEQPIQTFYPLADRRMGTRNDVANKRVTDCVILFVADSPVPALTQPRFLRGLSAVPRVSTPVFNPILLRDIDTRRPTGTEMPETIAEAADNEDDEDEYDRDDNVVYDMEVTVGMTTFFRPSEALPTTSENDVLKLDAPFEIVLLEPEINLSDQEREFQKLREVHQQQDDERVAIEAESDILVSRVHQETANRIINVETQQLLLELQPESEDRRLAMIVANNDAATLVSEQNSILQILNPSFMSRPINAATSGAVGAGKDVNEPKQNENSGNISVKLVS